MLGPTPLVITTQDCIYLLVIPWASPASTTETVVTLSVPVALPVTHVAHLIPVSVRGVSTMILILQTRKLKFRAGSDWPRVPQLERRGARDHTDHIPRLPLSLCIFLARLRERLWDASQF